MQTMNARAVDVPGMIRKVRRVADLNQRELAGLLGVDQATISRWETGLGVPDVVQFTTALSLASMAWEVLDSDGEPAEPMSDRPPVDAQRRRYPAHLDLVEDTHPLNGLPRLTTPHRRGRDVQRARSGLGLPNDHPTLADFEEQRRRRREERRARSDEGARARMRARLRRVAEAGDEADVIPLCCCPIGCEETATCPPTCPCGCERAGLSPGSARRD